MKGKNTPEKTKNVEKAREEQKMGEKTIEKNAITEGVIWKQLLIFFFPIMLGTLIQQLYTTVDTIIVGRFVGKAALASVGGPAAVLSTIVVTFFNGLANGAAVIIAQYYGAKDRKSLHVGLHTAYLFSIVISLIVSLVGTVLTPWLLTIMNTPQDMMADSTIYLRIYFMGILFTLVYNMGAAIMRAVGDSRRPLFVSAGLLCDEHHPGYRYGGRNEDGNCRSCACNCDFAVCQCNSGYMVADQGI